MTSSPFETIPLPPRLMVPIICSSAARPRPAGTTVIKGEPLTDTGQTAAPAAGTIIGPTRVTLPNGKIVDAVEMTTDANSQTESETPPPPPGHRQ